MIIIEKVGLATIIILTALSSILILYYKNFAILFGVIFLWLLFISEYRKNRLRKMVYKNLN